jgi:hypothetical protein
MESTRPKKLRAELKDYLDMADGRASEYKGKEDRLKRFKK